MRKVGVVSPAMNNGQIQISFTLLGEPAVALVLEIQKSCDLNDGGNNIKVVGWDWSQHLSETRTSL